MMYRLRSFYESIRLDVWLRTLRFYFWYNRLNHREYSRFSPLQSIALVVQWMMANPFSVKRNPLISLRWMKCKKKESIKNDFFCRIHMWWTTFFFFPHLHSQFFSFNRIKIDRKPFPLVPSLCIGGSEVRKNDWNKLFKINRAIIESDFFFRQPQRKT